LDLLVLILILILIGGFFYSRFIIHSENESINSSSSNKENVTINLVNDNIPVAIEEYLATKPQIQDKDGVITAKILDIESKPTSLTHVVSPDGLYLFQVNPENKYGKIRMEILCDKIDQSYFYKGEKIVIGKQLTFDFQYCQFKGKIESIQTR
jgi:hypothetical protein